jgi:outer membrane protein OmpA-like peptidoglycan-associated protein
VVTATSAANGSVSAVTSAPTVIRFALSAIPAVVTVNFSTGSSVLSSAAKASLDRLIQKLVPGEVLVCTGYGKGGLGQTRAIAVCGYLSSHTKNSGVIKSVTSSVANKATVRTLASAGT